MSLYVCLVFPDGLEGSGEKAAILRVGIPEYLGNAQMMYDFLKELVAG